MMDARNHAHVPRPPGVLALATVDCLHSVGTRSALNDATPRNEDASTIERLDDVAQQQPGADELTHSIARVRSGTRLLFVLGAFVMVAFGALAGFASLRGAPGESTNIFWLMGAVLGGQTVLLALWLVLMAFGTSALRRFSLGGFLWRTSRSIASQLAGARQVKSNDSRRLQHAASARAAATAATHADFGGARARWALSTLTHLAWMSFNIGLLGAVIALLSVRQFDFGWETTIGSPAMFETVTEALAIAPGQLGLEMPTTEQIGAAQIDPATAHASTDDDARVAARRVFSSFLLGSIALYGLAPRVFLFLISLGLWKFARRRWRPDIAAPRFAPLLRLIEPQAVRVDSRRTVQTDSPEEDATEAPAPDRRKIGSAILGLELETPPCGWPPPCGGAVEDLGIIESREDRAALVRRLHGAPTLPARLVLLANLNTTPDRGMRHTITQAIEATEANEFALLLSGGERFRKRVDAVALERRIEDWTQLLKSIVPNIVVREIDLDQLTASSRAKLAEVIGSGTPQRLPETRGPLGSVDAAFAEISAQVRRWPEAPTERDRLALHKAVARCAGAESGILVHGLPQASALLSDPKETLNRAAESIRTILPDRFSNAASWSAIGASLGVFACLATAATVAPPVLAALPAWLATGAATGAGLGAMRKPVEPTSDDAEVNDNRARSEAVTAAAMHAVLLALQGHGEQFIQRMIDEVFDGEPPTIDSPEGASICLSRWRSRLAERLPKGQDT